MPDTYAKPERRGDPANLLFPHQVGFTAPPHDFAAAPSDVLRICPDNVGVHGRMVRGPACAHELDQRVQDLHLLEEFVECRANIDGPCPVREVRDRMRPARIISTGIV